MTLAIENLSIAPIAPVCGGRIVQCDGQLLRARGYRHPVGSIARIGDSLAEVVGFRDDTTLLTPLTPSTGLVRGLRVVPHDGALDGGADTGVLGRVIDGLGKPIDGRGPLLRSRTPSATAARLGPGDRGRIERPFETGIRAIDALLTVGKGQRLAIAAPAGVGKTMLVQQILRSASVDVAVIGLIGERGREIADFSTQAMTGASAARTVIVASTSDQAAGLRLRGAFRASAIAEAFRAEGKSVLLIIDSLTRAAQAQREIGLALGEAPGMNAYPPSAFAVIPQLVERAGVDRRSGGSITAFYTVLAEAGDSDDPVVDATRAATDGHFVLSRPLAERGIFPAIDVAASLSRTMSSVVDADHLHDAMRVRRLWSLAEEYRELALLGGYTSGTDSEVDEALGRREFILNFVKQRWDRGCDAASSRAALAELAA